MGRNATAYTFNYSPTIPLSLEEEGGVWRATTWVLDHVGTGATPTDAIRALVQHDDFDAAVLLQLERRRAQVVKDDETMRRILQAKRDRRRRGRNPLEVDLEEILRFQEEDSEG